MSYCYALSLSYCFLPTYTFKNDLRHNKSHLQFNSTIFYKGSTCTIFSFFSTFKILYHIIAIFPIFRWLPSTQSPLGRIWNCHNYWRKVALFTKTNFPWSGWKYVLELTTRGGWGRGVSKFSPTFYSETRVLLVTQGKTIWEVSKKFWDQSNSFQMHIWEFL